MNNILDNTHVSSSLKYMHSKYVIVNADKANNNVVIICKKYYLECLIKELNIDICNRHQDENRILKNATYQHSIYKEDTIIEKHISYMNEHKIKTDEEMMKLPNFYGIPKMHKMIPKMRYIAASNKCTTKPLSTMITKCLKLITLQHQKYCHQIYKRTGVNRMWIILNSTNVLNKITDFNDGRNAKSVNTYDFSTLYTNIPHDDLKSQMTWVINKAFHNNHNKCMYIDQHGATWYKHNNTIIINKDTLIKHVFFLIDNIYIAIGDNIFQQTIGIPMGTDCAPFLANLYLYALEFKFLESLTRTNIDAARKFSSSFRYIDDLITFNNNLMDEYKDQIYPKELILNKENKRDDQCTFLDINIHIKNNKIITNLYDKRNDFKFDITNFPNLSGNIHTKRTHGIVISQLIRYSRVCLLVDDFITVSKVLIHKLRKQYFSDNLLRAKFSYFYDKYYHLITHYKHSKLRLMNAIFALQ